MKVWTIGKRMTVNALIVCLSLIILSSVAIYSLIEIDQNQSKVVHNYIPSLSAAAEINSGTRKIMVLLGRMGNAKTEERRQDILKRMDEASAANNDAFKQYEACILSQGNRDMYDSAVQKRDVFRKARKQYLELLASKPDQAEKFFEGELEASYADYMKVIDQMLAFNLKGSNEKGDYLNTLVTATITTVTIVSLVGVALGLISSVLSIRSINSALRRICDIIGNNSEQVASAAGQVSASSQILAEGASESAASIEETSSSMEEMSSIVQLNSNNAQASKQLAGETRQTANTNVEHMQDLKNSVAEAKSASGNLTGAMEEIKQSSDSIAKIIKTIDEIAFQTNILALNAAVEAARAGEAGMGFAVVADEVRNLAKRSADAAKETADIIEDSIRKGEAGVRINEEVVHKLGTIDEKSHHVDAGLQEILTKVGQVDDTIGQIATASKEQAQGIGQVNTAMTQMDKVTQGNAASAEETASASEELNAQAEELKSAVSELLALVEGQAKMSRKESVRPTGTNHAPVTKLMASTTAREAGSVGSSTRPVRPQSTVKPAPARENHPAGDRQTIPMDASAGTFEDFSAGN